MSTSSPLGDADVRKVAEEVVAAKVDRWKLAVSCFVAGLSIFVFLGITWADFRYFLFEKAYPPDVVYAKLKQDLRNDDEMRTAVATDILKLIGESVDSGYSRTFYFGAGVIRQPGQDLLQFYARPNQKVEITLNAQSYAKSTFALTVDNRNPFQREGKPNPTYPYTIVARDISQFLDFSSPSPLDPLAEVGDKRRYIHTIRVNPFPLPPKTSATFEVLVLVRNEKV